MKSQYKYTIVGTLPIFEEGRRIIRYRLMTKTAKKEVYKVVGLGALSTMYHDGLIEGYIDQYIKMKLGLPRRKIRSDRKRPVMGTIEKKWNLAEEWMPEGIKGWNLPNEWVAPNLNGPEKAVEVIETKPDLKINIKAYLYEDKGRWHVIECNGIEDEDTYPNKEWAQRVVDDLNNSSTDELDKV